MDGAKPMKTPMHASNPLSKDKLGKPIVMQSYPPRALDRRIQVDWTRDAREGPRVLMSLRANFGPMG